MPRPTWANDAQTTFLTEQKKDFTDSQAQGTSRTFLNSTTETFLERWPVEPPTAMEIGEEDGNVEAAKDKKLKKWQRRIEHWFRNHTRVNPSGATNTKTAVLSLAPKKTQVLLPYQAYMCLFRERVMGEIRTRFNKYKAALAQDDKPRGWWSFAIEQANRLLGEEPEDVKAQVDEFRRRPSQNMKAENIDIAKLEEMGADEAVQRVHALQQAINLLPRTGQEALKAIEAQTGFFGVLLVGGPNPETGRLVTLAIHNGRTVRLKNLFSDASEDWPVVQNAFDQFIGRCFDASLPGRLEKVYRGKTPAAAASAPSASTPASTSDAAQNPDASRLPQSPKQSSPTPELEPELDYEEQRSKNIARNAIIMKRLMAGEGIDAILESIDKDLPEDEDPEWLTDGLPEWVEEALEYLKGVCEEEWWTALLEEWVAFERALGFPDGQTQRNWLPTKGRPEEVKYWIGRGRQYDKPPKIKSVAVFSTTWGKWWARLQPSVRQGDNGVLAQELPQDNEEWAKVRRGGWNGLFMVIMCLSWWINALGEDDFADVQKAAADIKWACIAMTDPERLATDSAIAPSPTAPNEPAESVSVSPATAASASAELVLQSESAPTSNPSALDAPGVVASEPLSAIVAPAAAVVAPATVIAPAATVAPAAVIAPASTGSVTSESAAMPAPLAMSASSVVVSAPTSTLPLVLPPAIASPQSVVSPSASESPSAAAPGPEILGTSTEISDRGAGDASSVSTSTSVLTTSDSPSTPAAPVLSQTVAHVDDTKNPLGPPEQAKEKEKEDAAGAPLVGGVRSEGTPTANSVENSSAPAQQDVNMIDVSPTLPQGAVVSLSTGLAVSSPVPTIALPGELPSVLTSMVPCPKSPAAPGSPSVKRTNVDVEDAALEQVAKKARVE